jgi:hypothetical protein
MKALKNNIVKFILITIALIYFSCGDSVRNDQGVSFTFLGWFQDTTGDVGATGFITPLSSSASEVGGETTDVFGFAGLQNHLSGQSIRVQRVHHTYVVPGTNLNVPTTVVALSTVLAPTGAIDEDFNSDSSLPESHNSGEVISYSGIPVITAAVRSYLNLNRTQLPELPFVMIVRSYAVGITSAGRSLTSNDVETQIYFTEDVAIPPTSGEEAGTGGLGLNETFEFEEPQNGFNNEF